MIDYVIIASIENYIFLFINISLHENHNISQLGLCYFYQGSEILIATFVENASGLENLIIIKELATCLLTGQKSFDELTWLRIHLNYVFKEA